MAALSVDRVVVWVVKGVTVVTVVRVAAKTAVALAEEARTEAEPVETVEPVGQVAGSEVAAAASWEEGWWYRMPQSLRDSPASKRQGNHPKRGSSSQSID